MLDLELLQDTIGLLRQHDESGSAVDSELDDAWMQEIIELLNAYKLSHFRKITFLACYMLIYTAIHKHQELIAGEDTQLSRGILDGDYLFGLYYRLAASREEWKLVLHLTLFNKKMQLALIKGHSTPSLLSDLKQEFRTYLDRHCA